MACERDIQKPRPLLEEAYSALKEGESNRIVVAVAPTSYGKTVASPWIWREAQKDGLAGGLIHVAPLRSLVSSIYKNLFKPHGGRLQMHGAPEEDRSPYFLSSLVVTTLDSFLWNLYRIPVLEGLKVQRGTSMGHYYPALLGILSSLVVFDEAHMYLWEETREDPGSIGVQATLAALAALASTGVPVLVETATAQPQLIAGIAEVARRVNAEVVVKFLKAPRDSSNCPYLNAIRDALRQALGNDEKEKVEISEVEDKNWEECYLEKEKSKEKFKWVTRIEEKWEDALNEITNKSYAERPILVVANTVDEAVNIYNKVIDLLKKNNDSRKVVLIHGRLNERDRAEAERRIEEVEKEGGVVVATQVAEAGVDVNAWAVYTARAPLENLVQRAGRACRRGKILETCWQEGGRLVIIKDAELRPYTHRKDDVDLVLNKISSLIRENKGIDWRAPCDHDEVVSYGSLMAELYTGGQANIGAGAYSLIGDLLEKYLTSDARPWVLKKLMSITGMCSLARDSLMVEVEVEVKAGNSTEISTVPVSLDWVLNRAKDILKFSDNAPLLKVCPGSGGDCKPGGAVRLWETWKKWEKWEEKSRGGQRFPCFALLKSLDYDVRNILKEEKSKAAPYTYTVRFVANDEAYKKGLGLGVKG